MNQVRAVAPPHTRGWTQVPRFHARRRTGSPAHAGMDPPDPRRCRRSGWLPRTRGDGPSKGCDQVGAPPAPPHTRGWTLGMDPRRSGARGSPAHAGMDPCGQSRHSHPERLPRTRGDGPSWNRTSKTPGRAPPHTRGWTSTSGFSALSRDGSPAHAGMDPRRRRSGRRRARLPRTRGDGPQKSRVTPHGCAAPPHTRGWTPARALHGVVLVGSPAHAGMDPYRRGAHRPTGWLPRTRGDGPGMRAPQRFGGPAPPHTRGWTSAVPPPPETV